MSIEKREPNDFVLLDQRDEQQILDEIKGNIITEMFYSFKIEGRPVTGISWVGTKEIARQYGHIGLDFIRVDENDTHFIAVVKATDRRTKTSLLGTAMQPKLMKTRKGEVPDRFAYTKAVSKAQRNAIRAIIPERFLIEMYEVFKAGKVEKPPEAQDNGTVIQPRKTVESEVKIGLTKNNIDTNIKLLGLSIDAPLPEQTEIEKTEAGWLIRPVGMSNNSWYLLDKTLADMGFTWNPETAVWGMPP